MFDDMMNYYLCQDVSGKMQKKLTKLKNNIAWMNTYMQGTNIALQRYHLGNLPDTMKERDIKNYFLHKGNVIFKEIEGSWFALPGGGMNNINVNGYPGKAWVYGANGFNQEVDLAIPGGFDSTFARKGLGGTLMKKSDKAFLIRENYMMYPFINYVFWLADEIADCMRTLAVSRKHIKRPYIFAVPKAMRDTVLAELQDIDNNEECVITSGILGKDEVKYFPLDQSVECIKTTTDLIEWYWNLFYSMCGLNSNANPDKKAQISVAEVNSNNEAIDAYVASTINCIREDLEFFNKNAGLNITIEKTDFSEYNEVVEPEGDEKDEQLPIQQTNKDV